MENTHLSGSDSSRPFRVFVGSAFAVFIGLIALASGLMGVMGRGGAADVVTAVPNIITGAASVPAGVGYFLMRRWAVPAFMVGLAGLVVSNTVLYFHHAAKGPFPPAKIVFLAIPPMAAAIVAIQMASLNRAGRLK